jgi:hypothetical protein
MVVVALLALAVISVLALVGHRLVAAGLARLSEPVRALRALTYVGPSSTGLVAAVALFVADVTPGVVGALPVAAGRRGAALAAGLAYAVLVPVAVSAAYLGVHPALRDARDIDLGALEAAGRLYRYAVVLLALAVVLMNGLLVSLSGGVVGVVAGVAVVFLALVWGAPQLSRLTGPTRRPDDDERARLASLCDRAGLDPVGLLVRETRGSEQASALLRGPPGRRTLLVTDHFLAAYDDETAVALLASNAASARRYHLEQRIAPVVAGILSLLLVLDGTAPWWSPLGVLLAAVPLYWWGYRRVYAADAAAADRVGADQLLAAIDRAREVNDHGGGSLLVGALVMRPPVERRVERLRELADGPAERAGADPKR